MEEELGGAIEASSDVEVVWSVVDGTRTRLNEASGSSGSSWFISMVKTRTHVEFSTRSYETQMVRRDL